MDITHLDLAELRILLYALLALLALTVLALAFYLSRSLRKARVPPAPPQAELDPAFLEAEPQAPPAIHLEREPGSDRLVVEVAGRRYHRLSEIEDGEVRRRVMEAAAEMVDFAGVVGAGEPTLLPPDPGVHWREDLRRGMGHPPPTARGGVPPAVDPATWLLQQAAREPAARESLSLVSQVDQIVQRRLSGTRGLQGRSLRLRSTDGEKIVYEFDGAEYASVDDIPNHTARLLIQDAIREWEETQ